jgi:hypothetical protein
VTRLQKVIGSMLIRRRIAAARFTAGLAGTQVYPGAAHGYALVALVGRSHFYFLILGQVNAGFGFKIHFY